MPGDHGTTFGGNPVSCAAACAVVETIDETLLRTCASIGERFAGAALPECRVRGAGLLLGAELDRPPARSRPPASSTALLVGTAGETACGSRRR